ncbi:MAG: hypothetical protein WB791_08940, partial [Waddliaceae bacterium]
MKMIKLTENEFNFLIFSLDLPNNLVKKIIELRQQVSHEYVIHLENDDVNDIRDICGEKLQI